MKELLSSKKFLVWIILRTVSFLGSVFLFQITEFSWIGLVEILIEGVSGVALWMVYFEMKKKDRDHSVGLHILFGLNGFSLLIMIILEVMLFSLSLLIGPMLFLSFLIPLFALFCMNRMLDNCITITEKGIPRTSYFSLTALFQVLSGMIMFLILNSYTNHSALWADTVRKRLHYELSPYHALISLFEIVISLYFALLLIMAVNSIDRTGARQE